MFLITLLLISASAEPSASRARPAPADMQRARDGNVAIREEFDAARKAGTVAAYDRFIVRHPDHPLAKVAREERQRLVDATKEHSGHDDHGH